MTGSTPFWIDYWGDLKDIVEDVQDLFQLLFEKKEKQATFNYEDALSTALTDGIIIRVSKIL